MCLLEEMKLGQTHIMCFRRRWYTKTHFYHTTKTHLSFFAREEVRTTTTTGSKTDPIWSSVVPL